MPAPAKSIPVAFVGDRLAVSPEHIRFMLGYDDKPDSAWRKAFYKFRALNNIRPIPGTRVYSLKAIQKAVDGV